MRWSEPAEPLRICITRTQSQVPGLYDSSSRGGSAFYNSPTVENALHRGYVSIPDVPGLSDCGQSETQTHSIFLFYTVYLKPTLSISLFGGPQYSNTVQFGPPTIDGVVSGGRREYELAGEAHQSCSQLLAMRSMAAVV